MAVSRVLPNQKPLPLPLQGLHLHPHLTARSPLTGGRARPSPPAFRFHADAATMEEVLPSTSATMEEVLPSSATTEEGMVEGEAGGPRPGEGFFHFLWSW